MSGDNFLKASALDCASCEPCDIAYEGRVKLRALEVS